MRRARLISGLAAIVCVGSLAVIATSLARRQAVHAGRAGCATLGNAADFVVFSDGAFDSSKSAGTSVSGRIAAVGDVTLDGVSVSPAAGDSTPTVIAGGGFIAGRTTGNGGTLNGGVRYGGSRPGSGRTPTVEREATRRQISRGAQWRYPLGPLLTLRAHGDLIYSRNAQVRALLSRSSPGPRGRQHREPVTDGAARLPSSCPPFPTKNVSAVASQRPMYQRLATPFSSAAAGQKRAGK